MKKFFLVIAAMSFSTAVNSQELFRLNIGGPQTRILVLNATDDNAPIWIQIGGKSTKGPVMRGDQWGRAYGYGENSSVEVDVQICSTHETLPNSLVYPPGWAMDERKFESNTLTPEFLRSDPTEKAVKAHIKGIKKTLDGKLGRKEKITELDEWFRAVKRSGATPTVTGCQDPQFLTWVQDVSQWGYGRTTSVAIRGSRAKGYRADKQQ